MVYVLKMLLEKYVDRLQEGAGCELAAIDNPGLLRMESHSLLCHPRLDQGQGGLGVGLRAAPEDESVTVADDHLARVGHDAIPGRSIQMRQQRTPT